MRSNISLILARSSEVCPRIVGPAFSAISPMPASQMSSKYSIIGMELRINLLEPNDKMGRVPGKSPGAVFGAFDVDVMTMFGELRRFFSDI
jgi:hypothetical protein